MDQSKRLKTMQNQLDLLQSSSHISSPRTNQAYSPNIETRIKSLEATLNQVVKDIKAIHNSAPTSNLENSGTGYIKTGYAKLNSQNYFVEIFDSYQEGCVYKISFKSDGKGEFDLITLDKIKSRNGWQDVIEYDGPCTMAEATSYKLGRPGIIEKIDNQTWEVKQKLKIKISK